MASEWEATTLAVVVDVKHGFAFPGKNIRDEPPGDILLTPGNFAIGGGFKGDKFKYYDGEVPEDYVLNEGDLVVTMTDLSKQADTLGYPALVPKTRGPRFLHNQRLGKVLIKHGAEVDKGFLFYLLRTAEYRQEVLASATGTTVKHTSPGRILAHKASIPPLAEQKAIAAVLGALDDKIELNQRMNATLEAMARALFQSWFVDFDPVRAKLDGRQPVGLDAATAALFPDHLEDSPLGHIPEGWSVGSIYEIASVVYGAPFASSHFNADKIGKPLARIRDLSNESPDVFTTEVHPKGYLLKPGDIAVGMDGEFRAYLWAGAESWLNQRVCVFAPNPGFSTAFVRNTIIAPLGQVEATETATTVIHLGKNDIDRFKVIVPDAPVVEAFNEICQPWYDQIVEQKQQSRTLATLRDTLLPRLLAGNLSLDSLKSLLP
jgi:type I restriction enzyme S subunit